MKILATCLLSPVIALFGGVLFAADQAGVVAEYLPLDKMTEGRAITVQLHEDVQKYMQDLDARFETLNQKDKDRLLATIKPGQPVPFDPILGWTRETYDKYLESWKRKTIQETAPVAIGLYADTQPVLWTLSAVTPQGPLSLSTLKYNAATNAWQSPNGVLAFDKDVTFDELNVHGAWRGKEWRLKRQLPFATVEETLMLGKTDDKKYIYIIYSKREINNDDMVIDNQSVVLRLPAGRVEADPLLEKAKAKAAEGK